MPMQATDAGIPVIYNTSIQQGADWDRTFRYSQNGTPVDLSSGWTAKMQVRKLYSDPDPILEMDESGGIALDATGGINIHIPGDQTSALVDARYLYDVVITETATGFITRIAEGTLTLDLAVVR
jgi:hypothetical protein